MYIYIIRNKTSTLFHSVQRIAVLPREFKYVLFGSSRMESKRGNLLQSSYCTPLMARCKGRLQQVRIVKFVASPYNNTVCTPLSNVYTLIKPKYVRYVLLYILIHVTVNVDY